MVDVAGMRQNQPASVTVGASRRHTQHRDGGGRE